MSLDENKKANVTLEAAPSVTPNVVWKCPICAFKNGKIDIWCVKCNKFNYYKGAMDSYGNFRDPIYTHRYGLCKDPLVDCEVCSRNVSDAERALHFTTEGFDREIVNQICNGDIEIDEGADLVVNNLKRSFEELNVPEEIIERSPWFKKLSLGEN